MPTGFWVVPAFPQTPGSFRWNPHPWYRSDWLLFWGLQWLQSKHPHKRPDVLPASFDNSSCKYDHRKGWGPRQGCIGRWNQCSEKWHPPYRGRYLNSLLPFLWEAIQRYHCFWHPVPSDCLQLHNCLGKWIHTVWERQWYWCRNSHNYWEGNR